MNQKRSLKAKRVNRPQVQVPTHTTWLLDRWFLAKAKAEAASLRFFSYPLGRGKVRDSRAKAPVAGG